VADEKKLKVDIGSIEEAGQKLGQEVGKGINKGVADAANNLNSSELRKKLDETFSLRGLKENLVSMKDGLLLSKNKQNDMSKILAKNAELSKSFTSAIANGAGKGEILQKGLALAGNNIKGMVANINPYVAAFTVAVKLSQAFLKAFQATLETSKKFVGQNSLFTDQATMQMMQRTGQSATGAQGTNRALDRLGISFDDIQSGRVTQAQMTAFEELRKMETARLEEIAKVGGPTFEAMQKSALAMATTKQIIDDTITMIFAKSKGVIEFATQLESFATSMGSMIWSLADGLTPVVDLISGLLAKILGAAEGPLQTIIKTIVDQIGPIFNILQSSLDSIGGVLNSLFERVGSVLSIAIKIAGKFIQYVAVRLAVIIQVGGAIIEALLVAVQPILDIVETLVDLIDSFLPLEKAMKFLQPALDIAIYAIKWMGEGIAWLLKKVFEGMAWMQGKIFDFIDWGINLIPKAVHNMVNYIIALLNEIPFVNLDNLGDYQGISVGNALDNLGLSGNSILDKMTGDTINYNYGSTSTSSPASNANVNLFANMYTLVND
jgi:hypothetical protein